MRKVFILTILACGMCWGQAASDCKPASTNIQGAQFPCVYPDNRATFRLMAPDAKKVQVRIGQNYDMTRGADGMWSVTVPPQVVGFHYYYLIVDGVQANDPASEAFYGVSRESSGIEIPEVGVDFYSAKDVPHGEIRSRWYFSKITNAWRRCYVYTPPDYDTNVKGRYPVLYLLHGGGEDERGWGIQGHADFILDNSIAAGKAKPMLIVMDKAYATKPGEPPPGPPPTAPAGSSTPPPSAFAGSSTWGQVLIGELIPMIDRTYRTLANRDNRAIAGLSMGGGMAVQNGLGNLDKFANIASFSASALAGLDVKTSYGGVLSDTAAFNKKVRLLFISVGTAEERQFKAGNSAHLTLDKAGIKHVYFESPGLAHEWLNWRRALNEFAPRLFK